MPVFLGPAVNFFAIAYVIIILFFSFWPPETPVDAKNMNYCVLVTGGVISFSLHWYLTRGRKDYKEPMIQTSSTPRFLA